MQLNRGGYIQRKHLEQQIKWAIEDKARIPVSSGENQGYELGQAIGYTDGLRAALRLLGQLEDEPKPEPAAPWHHARKR